MKLTKDKYTVSRETLEIVLAALANNWFRTLYDGECYDEDNNDDIIMADEALQAELIQQGAQPD